MIARAVGSHLHFRADFSHGFVVLLAYEAAWKREVLKKIPGRKRLQLQIGLDKIFIIVSWEEKIGSDKTLKHSETRIVLT